jgi:hypothetical protein
MKYEDIIAAARIVRKYIKAVEATLYWNMTTREAREEVAEAERVLDVLETTAAAESTEVK